MNAIAFVIALSLMCAPVYAQSVDDSTAIRQCRIKGFYPEMTRHEYVRLLGEKFGDKARAKDACYKSEEEFAKTYGLSLAEARSYYGEECRTKADRAVLPRADLERVLPLGKRTVEEFTLELAFAHGIFFSFDEETGSYNYTNARDKCSLTISPDFTMSIARPAKPAGK